MSRKVESFEWIRWERIPESLPREYFIKVIAKTPASTDHSKDLSLPPAQREIRIYTPEEMTLAARSLAFRPINVNHGSKRPYGKDLPDAYVWDAEINEGNVEALCFLPYPEYLQKLREGKIQEVSIEPFEREDIKTEQGTIMSGLKFIGLALVEPPMIGGDPNTSISLFETIGLICKIESVLPLEVVEKRGNKWCVIHCHGPDAGKAIKCFDDKADADAMHGAMMANKETIEGEAEVKEFDVEALKTLTFAEIKIEAVTPPTPPTPPVEDPKDKRIKELETAVATATSATETLKKEVDKKVSDAKVEAKKEVIDKIKEKIPAQFIENKFGFGAKRFVEEVKKIVREEE